MSRAEMRSILARLPPEVGEMFEAEKERIYSLVHVRTSDAALAAALIEEALIERARQARQAVRP